MYSLLYIIIRYFGRFVKYQAEALSQRLGASPNMWGEMNDEESPLWLPGLLLRNAKSQLLRSRGLAKQGSLGGLLPFATFSCFFKRGVV